MEQKLEESEDELANLRMQAGAQARQIKTLLEQNPSSSEFSGEANPARNVKPDSRGVPQKINELTEYINGLEGQNEEMKQVIEAMDLRA